MKKQDRKTGGKQAGPSSKAVPKANKISDMLTGPGLLSNAELDQTSGGGSPASVTCISTSTCIKNQE